MKNFLVPLIASAALVVAPVSPLMAQASTESSDLIDTAWQPLSDQQKEEMRGGNVFKIVGGVITYCKSSFGNAINCAAAVDYGSKIYNKGKSWACQQKGIKKWC